MKKLLVAVGVGIGMVIGGAAGATWTSRSETAPHAESAPVDQVQPAHEERIANPGRAAMKRRPRANSQMARALIRAHQLRVLEGRLDEQRAARGRLLLRERANGRRVVAGPPTARGVFAGREPLQQRGGLGCRVPFGQARGPQHLRRQPQGRWTMGRGPSPRLPGSPHPRSIRL